MKTFAGMPINDFKKGLDEECQKWRDLEANDPEEYRRRVAAMQPTIDRYNSEYGIGDDDTTDDDEN
jgi:hypothetical protein